MKDTQQQMTDQVRALTKTQKDQHKSSMDLLKRHQGIEQQKLRLEQANDNLQQEAAQLHPAPQPSDHGLTVVEAGESVFQTLY